MHIIPFDMVADWQPERSLDLREIGKDVLALICTVAFVCSLTGIAALIAY